MTESPCLTQGILCHREWAGLIEQVGRGTADQRLRMRRFARLRAGGGER
ncbi:hypothetical protein [Streptomyces sp. NPDC017890]